MVAAPIRAVSVSANLRKGVLGYFPAAGRGFRGIVVKLNIKIDNKTYEVDVEAAEPEVPAQLPRFAVESAPVRVPAASTAPAPPADAKPVNEELVCRSPVAGVVVRVAAQEGQSLQVGDILLILEAMKMETNITAPVAGKVASIKVKAGDPVQAGQIVVEFQA
jgi:methylmalonyl-CoA carboxyltransferase small subunit